MGSFHAQKATDSHQKNSFDYGNSETDDHSDGEANVDLEYVGIEGYAYVPPGHEPVPPDHRL